IRCAVASTSRCGADILRLFCTLVPILPLLVGCADPEHGRRDSVAVWVPRRAGDTTTVSAPPPRIPDSTPPPTPQDTLPAGYTLTDTTNWGTIEEDGQRAVLRRGGVAIDTVDLTFGVAAVGQDSLVFFPVRTDSLPLPTTSVPSYESYPTEHVLWTPVSRRELRKLLPSFNAFISSPTTPREGVIHYWGLQPHDKTNRVYAMRYNFRTAHLDSLFLDREDPVATDYRYHFGLPQIHRGEVSFDGIVVDSTTWQIIRHDSVSH
ncbi:MAG TPA: hypothetical protein VGL17_11125, partial [Gemmatimonadaceae bacterium]